MKAAREDWVDGQDDLDAVHLIFIDESGLSTKMARLRGWAPKGERCRAAIPHGHWKTVTFVGGLRSNRLNIDTGACFGRPLTAALFTPAQRMPSLYCNNGGEFWRPRPG